MDIAGIFSGLFSFLQQKRTEIQINFSPLFRATWQLYFIYITYRVGKLCLIDSFMQADVIGPFLDQPGPHTESLCLTANTEVGHAC